MARPAIRAAVVGIGFVGVAHVEALRRLGVDVVGVVGSSPARAALKAAAANLPRIYDSYEACLGDPAVDVVHIASPNHVHADQARAALTAGTKRSGVVETRRRWAGRRPASRLPNGRQGES